MSAPAVDLSLPGDAQLLAAANPNPQAEAARLTDAGDPGRVADLGRRLQQTGADLDGVHQQSWRTQSVLAGAFANDGGPVYDAAAHRRLLPGGFSDAGTRMTAVGRRVGVVSEELSSAIGDLRATLDGLTADLGRRRSAFAAEVAAARGPGGLIALDAVRALQARRQAVAATMQELVDACGRRVLGRIGVYELSLNDTRRLLAEFEPAAESVTTATPGVPAPSGLVGAAGARLEGGVSGFTVPTPLGPSVEVQPVPPPAPTNRGFTPLVPGLDGPLITRPAPALGAGVQDGPGSGQGGPGAGVHVDAADSGDPIAGSRPHRGRFPRTAGPNDILVTRGNDGKVNSYEVYDAGGLPVKRVDVRGRSHGGVDTPHVLEFERNTDPRTGQEFVNDGEVRRARPDEVEGLL